jgi:anthraniloyl-CoA monooxygenase
MKVHIVGGGPAGLYFAILMKKAWPQTRITVFERNKPDDTFGFGVVFSDQTLEAFESYDRETYRQIVGHFAYWDDIEIHFRGTTHRIGGNGFCGTSRTMLLKILGRRAHALGIEVKYQSEADPLKNTIRGADLVVAADGINSAIRDQLGLLKRRIYGRDCGARINIPRRPQEIAADDRDGTVMIEAWADRRRVLYCPVKKDEFYVLLTCTVQDKMAAVSPIDPDVWTRSFPFMRELFVRMRDEADWPDSHWAHFQTIHLKRWSAGRIAVLGDAAHAMPPYLAQGAGHAMMNALGLAEALTQADTQADSRTDTIEAALAAWERRERPLTEHTQLWTRIYGATMFLPAPLKTISILVEKLPWVAAQYIRAANHVPTGCTGGIDIGAQMGGAAPA